VSDALRTGKRGTHHDRASNALIVSGLVQASLDARGENNAIRRTSCGRRALRRGMARQLLQV